MDRRHAIRELRSGDAQDVQAFVRRLSPESRRRRFFAPISELMPNQLARVTRGAGPDDVNLGAFDGAGRIVGLAQYVVERDTGAEFAVVVDDALQRSGLGERLVGLLIERAREGGVGALHGLVQNDNWPMLGLAAKLGFELLGDPDPRLLRVERSLVEAHAI
jgi:acetyltransferase